MSKTKELKKHYETRCFVGFGSRLPLRVALLAARFLLSAANEEDVHLATVERGLGSGVGVGMHQSSSVIRLPFLVRIFWESVCWSFRAMFFLAIRRFMASVILSFMASLAATSILAFLTCVTLTLYTICGKQCT